MSGNAYKVANNTFPNRAEQNKGRARQCHSTCKDTKPRNSTEKGHNSPTVFFHWNKERRRNGQRTEQHCTLIAQATDALDSSGGAGSHMDGMKTGRKKNPLESIDSMFATSKSSSKRLG